MSGETKWHPDQDVVGGFQYADPSTGTFQGTALLKITAAGKLASAGLPTADPHVVGEIWANSGVLTISAG